MDRRGKKAMCEGNEIALGLGRHRMHSMRDFGHTPCACYLADGYPISQRVNVSDKWYIDFTYMPMNGGSIMLHTVGDINYKAERVTLEP